MRSARDTDVRTNAPTQGNKNAVLQNTMMANTHDIGKLSHRPAVREESYARTSQTVAKTLGHMQAFLGQTGWLTGHDTFNGAERIFVDHVLDTDGCVIMSVTHSRPASCDADNTPWQVDICLRSTRTQEMRRISMQELFGENEPD